MEQSILASERLKIIEQPIKDTVFGFIKSSQNLLPPKDTYYNIPSGVHIICLLYYSPILSHGIYQLEGHDESESKRTFKAEYDLEFVDDGTIFGTRGTQLICGGWSPLNHSINFMLTWQGNCYQYTGYYDTISNEIYGKWYIKNEKKRQNKGQYGTFKYQFKYKSKLKKVEHDPNNVHNIKLHYEYQNLLTRYETMRRNTSQVINAQDVEIFALKLLLLKQCNEIELYRRQVHDLTELKNGNQDTDDEKKEIDYTQWKWTDILQWIMSLHNGTYRQYMRVLEEKLRQEELNGNHLQYLDKNDLHRFGIVHFEDKLNIYQSIQSLIGNKNEKSETERVSDD